MYIFVYNSGFGAREVGSGEYKQVPTRQDGPSRSYGTQRVAVEREGNPALQKTITIANCA